MPGALIGAVIAGLASAAGVAAPLLFGGTAAFLGATGGWAIAAAFGVGFVGSLIMSGASMLLSQSQPAREIPFQAEATARTQMVRSSIASRKIVLGETQVSGALVFAASFGSAGGQGVPFGSDVKNRDNLALVIVLAGHQSSAIKATWLDDKLAQHSQFAGRVTQFHHLGSPDQVANADLVSRNVGWTNAHRLRGLTYLVLYLNWNQDAFPTGIPNVKVLLRGLGPDLIDPRTALPGWTDNGAVLARRYLMESDWGLNAHSDEVAGDTFIAAAHTSDEEIELVEEGRQFTASGVPSSIAWVQGPPWHLQCGDRVRLSTDGALPAPLSPGTPYYVVPYVLPESGDGWMNGIQFAASLADARGGNVITMTSWGSGRFEVYRTHQPRYRCNGVIDCAKAPADIMDDLMTACAGAIVYQQGAYRHYVGAATTPVGFSITTADLRGPIKVRPRRKRRETANAVRGTFIDPERSWQPSDFPPLTNDFYKSQDLGEPIWRDIALSFTNDVVMAQRLAKIALEAVRQGGSLVLPLKVKGLQLAFWDVVRLDIPELGYDGKLFQVIDWTLGQDFGIDVEVREYAAAIFDWAKGNATTRDLAPDTTLPDPRLVTATVNFTTFVEEHVPTRSGAGVATRLTITWSLALDAFVVDGGGYEVEYRLLGTTRWQPLPRVGTTQVVIEDIAAGNYEFRVRAVNSIGVHGPWSPIKILEVKGLTERPADITGFSYQALQGKAELQWDAHPDLDVRIGGHISLRWSPDTIGASESSSTDLFPGENGEEGGVPGNTTHVAVPLLSGTYFARAVDSSGNVRLNAAIVITRLPDLIHMNLMEEVDESPGFAGTRTNLIPFEGGLRLDFAGNIDAVADVDAVPNMDQLGNELHESGSYHFAAPIDLGAVFTARVRVKLAMMAFNAFDSIDGRTEPIDSWPSFDGPVVPLCNVVPEIRTTDDDPTDAGAVWTPWAPFIVGNYRARGFDFQVHIRRLEPQSNVNITTLGAIVDAPDRTESGRAVSSASGDVSVSFALAFASPPNVNGQILGALSANEWIDLKPENITATGFPFSVRDAAGNRIVRTVDWFARGYGDA